MNAAVCGALTAVFPLILLALLVERRNLNPKLRRVRMFRKTAQAAVTSSLIGTVLAVIGLQFGGFPWPQAIFIWCFFVVAIFGLGLMAIMLVATHEIEEDAGDDR
jgi:ABC-type Na+ efflux pump permease subunit